MKKFMFLFVAAISLLLVSCEGPEGPMGPRGYDGYDGLDGKDGIDGKDGYGTNWYVAKFTVKESDWLLSGNSGDLNSFFYADKPLKELDEFVFNSGTIVAYIETAKGVKNGLPYVLHLGGSDDKGEFLWTQTYDFDFWQGGVRFYLTYSDFNTQVGPEKGDQTFHVVLMW